MERALVGDHQRVDVVRVGIDETREQRFPPEIDNLGIWAPVQIFNVGTASNSENPAVLDGECLSGRLRIIDGNDIAAHVDCIGSHRHVSREDRRDSNRTTSEQCENTAVHTHS